MHFMIQKGVFGDEETLLCNSINELCDSGMITLGFERTDIKSIPESTSLTFSKTLVPRGSIKFVKKIEKITGRKFITLKHYLCSNYYQHYREHLLNSDYLMLPYGDLGPQKERIFRAFDTDKLFIRPNSGRKIFTGTTLTKKWWDKELEVIRGLPTSKIKNTDIVLISSYKEVGTEYRLLMHRDHIVDYCRYSEYEHGNDIQISGLDWLSYWPDVYWTADISVDEIGNQRLIEINSFNSAGLYEMDYKKIIKYMYENKTDGYRKKSI